MQGAVGVPLMGVKNSSAVASICISRRLLGVFIYYTLLYVNAFVWWRGPRGVKSSSLYGLAPHERLPNSRPTYEVKIDKILIQIDFEM